VAGLEGSRFPGDIHGKLEHGCQPAALREDIKSDDTGLVATDDNPPTEWNVSGTSSQAAPALEERTWTWPEGVHVVTEKQLTKSDVSFERGTLTLTRPLGEMLKEILGGLGEISLVDAHGATHESLRLREHASNGSYYIAGWGKVLRAWKPKIDDHVAIARAPQVDAHRTLAVAFSSHNSEQPNLSWLMSGASKPAQQKLESATIMKMERGDVTLPAKLSRKRAAALVSPPLSSTWVATRRSGRTRRGACEEEPAQENGSESGSIVESTGVNPSVVDESLTVPMDSEASTPTTRVAATAETPEAPAPECLAESKTNLETSSQASSAPSTDALDFLAAIAQLDANKENSEAMSPRVVQGEAIQASDKLQAPAESPGCFVQVPVHTQLI